MVNLNEMDMKLMRWTMVNEMVVQLNETGYGK